MKVLVVGTDRRMREVYYHFASYVETRLINEATDLNTIHDFDVLVLPIRGVDEDGNLLFSKKIIQTNKQFWEIAKKGKIFSGSRCHFLSQLNVDIDYYMEDETLKKENAILTAEGILYYMIDHTVSSIYQLKVDIIGKGICGKAFGQLLKQLGISHRYVRRVVETNEDISIGEWKEVKSGDVIIITAPVPIIDDKWLYQQQNHPLLINITSEKVIDDHLVQTLGFPYIKALGIPGMFACKSAGLLIFNCIWGKLHE